MAALAIAATLLVSPVALAAPSPSPTADQRRPDAACRSLPATDPTHLATRFACDLVTAGPSGPVQDVQQSAGEAASQVGQAAAGTAEVAFTRWLADGAVWLLRSVARKTLDTSTTPNLDPARAAAFAQVYGRVAGIALALSVLLALIGVIEAVLTRQPGGLKRVVTGMVVSGICLGAVPAGTAILVRIVDELTQYVGGGPTVGAQSLAVPGGLQALGDSLLVAEPTTGAATLALTAIGILAGGALLWVELVTRESLIYLFVGVAPLASAAVQWPRLEGVLRQVLFAGLALILSKLVIAIALAVGFSLLALGAGLESLLGGMFVILVAAVMPFATARVLPLAADELTHAHQGRIRSWAAGSAVSAGRNLTAIATGGGYGLGAVVGLASSMVSAPRARSEPGLGSSQRAAPGVAANAAAGSGPPPGQAWGRPGPQPDDQVVVRRRSRRRTPRPPGGS